MKGKTMVQYLEGSQIVNARITEAPRFYSASGYGRKIPTRHLIQLVNKRWHRVYVCQISNAGTAYVLIKNEWRVIGPDAEIAIERFN
jgi:hypothetical protein